MLNGEAGTSMLTVQVKIPTHEGECSEMRGIQKEEQRACLLSDWLIKAKTESMQLMIILSHAHPSLHKLAA